MEAAGEGPDQWYAIFAEVERERAHSAMRRRRHRRQRSIAMEDGMRGRRTEVELAIQERLVYDLRALEDGSALPASRNEPLGTYFSQPQEFRK
jgi:hypothetical protein